jgi:hypothetical protein
MTIHEAGNFIAFLQVSFVTDIYISSSIIISSLKYSQPLLQNNQTTQFHFTEIVKILHTIVC